DGGECTPSLSPSSATGAIDMPVSRNARCGDVAIAYQASDGIQGVPGELQLSSVRAVWLLLRIEVDRGADQRLEGLGVHLLALAYVDRAPRVPVEARAEELGRVVQRGALHEGQLDDLLVRLARADDA